MSSVPPLTTSAALDAAAQATHSAQRSTVALGAMVALIGLALLGLWDASGLDLPLARLFGDVGGFDWRNQWWMTRVLHDGARNASWALTLGLAVMIFWPRGVLRCLSRRERIGLLIGMLGCLTTMSLMKFTSTTSCPWDLSEFGGTASYVSHWRWGVADGGGGHCFPAGHATAGFAWVSGWFWLRERAPRAATVWLCAALLAGTALGLAQQIRGAHFMSHTLWTAWLCWTVSGAVWWALRRWATAGLAAPR